MPSTFTPNLNLEKPAGTEQVGTWGTAALNPNADKIDAKFDGATGHSHDGTAGEGPILDHDVALTNVGTNTHAEIDAELADHEARIVIEESATVDHETRIDALETGAFAHLPTSFAPVSFLDLFTYPPSRDAEEGPVGYDFSDSPWEVAKNDPDVVLLGTGDSLALIGDPSADGRDTPEDADVLFTAPVDMHSQVQRAVTKVSIVDLTNMAVGDAIHVGLVVLGARALGALQFVDDGVLTTTSVVKVGADAYDIVKSVVINVAGTTVKSAYLDIQSGLTGANTLPYILGTHELSVDADGRLYLYHDRTLLLRSAADTLSAAILTNLQASLTGAGLPEWGAAGVFVGFSLDPLGGGTTQIELRYAGVYGSGELNVEDAEPLSSTANRTAPELEVVGELCVTAGFWAGTSVGDFVTYMGARYKVVGCSDDPYGFIVNDFVTGPGGARASVIPGVPMSSSGILPLYRSGLDNVAPEGAEPPPILEGTEGQVIDVLMATNVPPDVQVTVSAGITLRDVRYIDTNTVRLFFDTDPSTEGDPFEVTFTSESDPANTYTEEIATIEDAPVEFVSFEATLNGVVVDPPTEGSVVNYTLKVKNVDPGATVLFTGADVTGQSAVIVDSTTITGTLTLAEPRNNVPTSVAVTNPGATSTFTEELFTAGHAAPEIDYVTINTTAVGVGRTGTLVGRHFDAAFTGAVSVGGGAVANFVPVFGSSTLINFTIDVVIPAQDIEFQITNTGPSLSDTVRAFRTGPDVTPVQAANADVIQEGLPNQAVTILGVGLTFDRGARVTSSVAGAIAITGFVPDGPGLQQNILIDYSPDPGTAGATPTFTVINPNGQNSAVAATNPIANEPTPTGPFVYTPSSTFEPGDAGVLTIDAVSGFVDGVEVTTPNPETDIVLGDATFVGATQVTVEYRIPRTAVPGTSIVLDFTNPGGTAAADSTDIEFPAPVIHDIRFDAKYENTVGVTFRIRGKNFQAGLALDFTLGDPGVINVAIGSVTPEVIEGTLDFQSATAGNNITFEVTNPDGKLDTDVFTIAATPTPVIAQFVVDVNEEGAVGQTIVITGKFLYPTATYAFTGGIFANIVEVSREMGRWVFTADVVGAAGSTGGIDITYDGTLYSFPDLLTVEAVPAGPPLITSVVLGALTDNATGVTFEINGTGLGALNVDEVRFPSDVPARLPLDFFGQNVCENIQIVTQTSTKITGTMDLNGSISGIGLNRRYGLEQRTISTELYLAAALQTSDPTTFALVPDAAAPDLSAAQEAAFLANPANLIANGLPRIHVFTFAKAPAIGAGNLQTAALPVAGTPGIMINAVIFIAPNQFSVNFTVQVGVPPGTQCEILFTDTVPAVVTNPYSVIRFQST